jgi:hypothetical protein
VVEVSVKKPKTFLDLHSILDDVFEQLDLTSFFIGKHWLKSWLISLDSIPNIYVFLKSGKIAGFCFVGEQRLYGVPCTSNGFLNQTGLSKYDQSWIEYNGIVCQQQHKKACSVALLKHYFRHPSNQRFTVSMTSELQLWNETLKSGCFGFEVEEVKGYKANLKEWSKVTSKFEFISKNSYRQLNRSTNLIEQHMGPIKIKFASEEENTDFFDALGVLHRKKWENTLQGSGFNNKAFEIHHKNLFKLCPEKIDLIKVDAGIHTLGYIYNIKHRNSVYFYCSGINFEMPHNHIKPGYSIHYELMKYYRDKGFEWYDFLGGEAQYKKSLSSTVYSFNNLVIYKSNFHKKVLRAFKSAVQLLKS